MVALLKKAKPGAKLHDLRNQRSRYGYWSLQILQRRGSVMIKRKKTLMAHKGKAVASTALIRDKVN